MAITNIGAIYDLETKQKLQLIVISDGVADDLLPHKLNLPEGQAWLDIPTDIYTADQSAIDQYIQDNG